jgi:hypothetical protein
MNDLALSLLAQLLRMAEKHEVGSRSRPPALTASALSEYHAVRELERKEAIEAAFKAARAERVLRLTWDRVGEKDGGYVQRVDLVDAARLARFLNVLPASEIRAAAAARLKWLCADFPVIEAVLERWGKMKTVRGYGPDDAAAWHDAVLAVRAARELGDAGETPIRNFSARVFSDSKRVESLTPVLDVLLAGRIDAEIREPHAVWLELGLVREEQPVRLAGSLRVVRTRVAALLDAPYSAFPAAAVTAIERGQAVAELLSIENLTTFHQEAKRRCDDPVLLIYTGGAPSPAWRAMYGRLLDSLPASTLVRHWGDVDEGGFRIAAQIAAVALDHGRLLQPCRMAPSDVPPERRKAARPGTVESMKVFAKQAGWADIAAAMDPAHGFTVEQESL